MPRYDYECQTCHHEFELKQSFASEPVATCPNCMNAARRVIHSVPIVFKGSGFYVNDYGKGSSNNSTSKPSDPSSEKSEKNAEGKADSTPAGDDSSKSSKIEPKKVESKKEHVSTK